MRRDPGHTLRLPTITVEVPDPSHPWPGSFVEVDVPMPTDLDACVSCGRRVRTDRRAVEHRWPVFCAGCSPEPDDEEGDQ